MATFRSQRLSSRLQSIVRSKAITIVLLAGIVAYSARDQYYFSNGAGGPDWQIGKAQVNVFTAHHHQSLADMRQFSLDLVNRDRHLNGLPSLVADPLLAEASQRHAEDMLQRNFFDHVSPDGLNPTDRFLAVGGTRGAGENIIIQQTNAGLGLSYGLAEQFQRGWMYSDGHRQNLLHADYKTFGYGIAIDPLGSKAYAVQMFSTPAP